MEIGNLVRLAPSGHKRALHSLILQYIQICANLDHFIPDKDILPYMDLSKKITGFHSIEDNEFLTNPWNRYFIQPILKPNTVFRMELVGSMYDFSILLYNNDLETIKRYNQTIKEFLVFRPHIIEKVNLFEKTFFEGTVAGIHIRGTDSFFDRGRPNLPISYFEKLIEEKLGNYSKIFIASDNINVIQKLQSKFGSRIVFYVSKRLDIDAQNVALHETIFNDSNIDYGEEVLIESILLSKCDLLIRQQSNVSTFSKLLNPDIKIHQFDLPLWHEWNYHCCTEDTFEERKKFTEQYYYQADLEINDIEYYKNVYEQLHERLTQKEPPNRLSTYIYNSDDVEYMKNYFYIK